MAVDAKNNKTVPDQAESKKVFDRVGQNINQWQQYYSHNQTSFREDKIFLFVDQWSPTEREELKRLKKPILTYNVIYDYFKKVVGQQRYSTPQLMLRREDDNFSGPPMPQEAIQKEIDLRTDIIKDIAYNSRSDIAYQTAFENSLAGGFGALRVYTEYKDAYSFDQHVLIEGIDHPERCFFDPNAKMPTKHDGDFVGYYETMTHEEFKSMYPDIPEPKSYPMNANVRNFTWADRDTVTVVEYYEKKYFSFDLYLLDDGQRVTTKQYNRMKKEYEEEVSMILENGGDPLIIPPLPQKQPGVHRRATDYKIMYYKMSANHILECSEFCGKEFPIIFVAGDLVNVDGREYTISFTRYVKDPQRFFNYIKCEIAQAIKNSRREQYMATPDNIAGFEEMWQDPTSQQGALMCNPDPQTGALPQRQPPYEIASSMVMQAKESQQEIASILGLFEANRGQDGKERSGLAIKERQRTGNLGLIVFFDNLDRAVEQVGRVVLSMLPKIYDTERSLNLTRQDKTTYSATVNQKMPDGSVQNDLTKGKYTLHVEAGPSFAAQRDDALNILIQLASINPEVFPAIADLIAENVDIENRTQLVERLKNFVPQAMLATEEGEAPPPKPPNPQEQMAQMATMMKQKELQLKEQELELKAEQTKLEGQKMLLNAQGERRKDYVSGVKANAETHKAQLDYHANVMDALARIEATRADLEKSRREMFK